MYSTLWIDGPEPRVTETGWLGDALHSFLEHGFAIIPGAVAPDAIARYLRGYAKVVGSRVGLQVVEPNTPPVAIEDGDPTIPGAKVLDTYRFVPGTAELIFSPRIEAFLRAVFQDDILAFQGLHFEVGSTQAIHQDTAYVVVDDRPLNLVASWIALEDVQPGSGELVYYPGSHRWPHFLYGGEHKHAAGHDPALHHEHLMSLPAQAADRGVPRASFLPRKGDVLFWHADLAHGGGEITRAGATRRSLVTHYCPRSDMPHYFRYAQFAPQAVGSNATVSMYYDANQTA